MKQPLLSMLAVTMLCFSSLAWSEDPAGDYRARGSNPGGGSYSGSVTISRTGETYSVTWRTGAGQSALSYTGTGILTGDILSVAYIDEHKRWIGVIAYEIQSNGHILEGQWTGLSGTQLESETLTRR